MVLEPSGGFQHAGGRLHVHRHDARHTLLLHGHADELLRHLHRDLVVADEEELRFLGHGAHQSGVALGVGVVQWCVHLVEQAERRGVELEDGEHQGDGGERLLAAREQVDGLVLLAGRLGHHLHAGVQDLLSRHHQPGVAAAEQLGEHAAEVFVDGLESGAQQLTGLVVDLLDRVFERGDGLVQVGRLRVEEGLALARGRQFVQRRQVDRAQALDVAVQAVDLTLQAGQAHVAFGDALRDGGAVGLGLVQHLAVLLHAQARGLFLELEVGDAAAQGLQLTFQLKAALVAGAQLGRQVVVLAAQGRQGLLALGLGSEGGLQAGLGGGVGQARQFFLCALLLVGQRLFLLARGVDGALQLSLARLQAAQREGGLLRLALQ